MYIENVWLVLKILIIFGQKPRELLQFAVERFYIRLHCLDLREVPVHLGD